MKATVATCKSQKTNPTLIIAGCTVHLQAQKMHKSLLLMRFHYDLALCRGLEAMNLYDIVNALYLFYKLNMITASATPKEQYHRSRSGLIFRKFTFNL